MPLVNFGSILSFAEEIEIQHYDFLTAVIKSDVAKVHSKDLDSAAKNAWKRIKEVQRVRRENVTEMILETIEGFVRTPFIIEVGDAHDLVQEAEGGKGFNALMQKSIDLEERAITFYDQAAEKLKGQAEVARALKNLKKKHTKEKDNLSKLVKA